MSPPRKLPWFEIDKPISGLATDKPHEIAVQREAIPIIFVPGVMGSRLRVPGTNGEGENEHGLPNLRWDPAPGFLWNWYSGRSPAHRKRMLIGDKFDPNYLEVDNDNPVGDGFRGLMAEYREYLVQLRERDWGALGKVFVFPVYGFGYNWSDTNRSSGKKLAARIDQVIAEGKKQIGLCEKVILVTHSMGGLVARAACSLAGAAAKVLGVIHGVQPAHGAAAAYWRMKAGFEASGISGTIASRFLGPTGRDVTALLANSIGGLQLLPTKNYRTESGRIPWLMVTGLPQANRTLPRGDPYEEIYRVPAVVKPAEGHGFSNNVFWGLVDKNLLVPERVDTPAENDIDAQVEGNFDPDAAWNNYKDVYLKEAEAFHNDLGVYKHPVTKRFWGAGLDTAETIRLEIESNWVRSESYPTRGFRGFLRGADGAKLQAVLQDPDGNGDGTVPVYSAMSPNTESSGDPTDREFPELEHQPAYENENARRWTTAAIVALCRMRFKERRGG